MAKIYGLFGSMTGKLADTVLAVRNGEQIARKYQPIVSNPNTEGQVAARAKLKLMSQLSAVMAPVIAMPRVGTVSSRNRFVKTNYGTVAFAAGQADIELTAVKLTQSVVSMFPIQVTSTAGSVTVQPNTTVTGYDIDRVVYVLFEKRSDNTLRLVGSQVSSSISTGATFQTNAANCVAYAYGVRDNNENATAKFADMQVVTAETVAKLIVTRVLTEADVTLTETVAATYSQS